MKEDKSYRIVIRHLHPSTDTELIKESIEALGYKVRNISKVLHRITKVPLPLFFVDLAPDSRNSEIFKVTNLLYTKIKVEEPHPTKDIVQCKRCQDYGHTRSYCQRQPRCVKCAGPHLSDECAKKRDMPAKCALCSGDHPANYKGCATHKKLQQLRQVSPPSLSTQNLTPGQLNLANYPPLRKETSTHQSQYVELDLPPTTENNSQQAPTYKTVLSRRKPPSSSTSHPQAQSSYGLVTGQSIPQPPIYDPLTNLTPILNSFLSEMKALITPLITLLTTLVTELLPKPNE